jgi:nitrite reductase/ring-hydroxylating ferredoxin subunit
MQNAPIDWRDLPGAPSEGTKLIALDAIFDGGAYLGRLASGDNEFRFILLRSGSEAFCYLNRCAHFGVPLSNSVEHLGVKPYESIHCSVHYARYRWRDGYCEHGDCEGESLIQIPVEVIDGQVVVSGQAGP